MAIINDKAVRYLYGEGTGISGLDACICYCLQCGKSFIEVFPEGSIDEEKKRVLTVQEARNLNVLDEITRTDRILCTECRILRPVSKDTKLQMLGWFFFIAAVAVIVAFTVLQP